MSRKWHPVLHFLAISVWLRNPPFSSNTSWTYTIPHPAQFLHINRYMAIIPYYLVKLKVNLFLWLAVAQTSGYEPPYKTDVLFWDYPYENKNPSLERCKRDLLVSSICPNYHRIRVLWMRYSEPLLYFQSQRSSSQHFNALYHNVVSNLGWLTIP